jgi:ABC-type lipoprotein export system ATPase subunit
VGEKMSVVLEATGLKKTYKRGSEHVHALDGVSISLATGELVGLTGRSGSGKTTLLNVLAGWEHPDVGALTWGGGRSMPARIPWGRMSMLPQAHGLIEELTIEKNIALPARLSGHTHDFDQLMASLAESLGLGDLMDRYPKETSIGQQQRCALARCLVLRPDLLLADEPTGHQDSGWGARVWSELQEAASDGTCVLVATHSDEGLDRATRLLAMADGRITEVPDRASLK